MALYQKTQPKQPHRYQDLCILSARRDSLLWSKGHAWRKVLWWNLRVGLVLNVVLLVSFFDLLCYVSCLCSVRFERSKSPDGYHFMELVCYAEHDDTIYSITIATLAFCASKRLPPLSRPLNDKPLHLPGKRPGA